MGLIEIKRDTPPELAVCRAAECRRAIEWVSTPKGKRLPLDVPVKIAMETATLDGVALTFVDTATVHWASCPAAWKFSGKQKGGR
jgi:hypothetical protein